MTTIQFVDELPGCPGKTASEDIAQFAKVLRKRRNKWAIYPWSEDLAAVTRKNRASDINRGRPSAPAALRHGFEAAVRDGVLYVRYTGRPAR